MAFTWDERNIKWFLDAADYTGFYRELARQIIPYLAPGDSLCDVGCGLGRLAFELAPYVSALAAIDVNEVVVDIMTRDAAPLGLDNLYTRLCDASDLDGVFDVVLLSFFGETDTPGMLEHCSRSLIRIVSANNKTNLYPERYRSRVKETVPGVCDELSSLNIGYKLEQYAIEFGQPLRDMRDAELYVLQNAPEASADEVSGFLTERLQQTGRDDFPLYLPNKKELGVFIIDK